MKSNSLSFASGADGPQTIGGGAPVDCAADGVPFRIESGEAELFLQTQSGRHYLLLLAAGQSVYPATAGNAHFILIARGAVGIIPLAEAERGANEQEWRAALDPILLETGEPVPADTSAMDVNARLAEALEARAQRAEQEELARIRSAGQNVATSQEARRSLAQMLDECATSLGTEANDPGPRASGNDFDTAPIVARRMGLSIRTVALTRDWFRHEQGPLILHEEQGGEAVVTTWHRGHYRDADGEPISGHEAANYGRTAYLVSAPLPERISGFRALARYVLAGNRTELWTIVRAATFLAILGAITPLAMGWILSDIAPSGDAALLFAVGAGLLFAAILGYLLETVRGMAVSRIQGKTSARLSTAIFDRVLRLPTSFFREMSAGDLNQRLAGIDEIRELVLSVLLSAGLSAILSIFYFGVLASYDLKLALISVALISVFVGIVVVTRALQVPVIRAAYAIDGDLAEQSYELIGSVAKLRSTAAETRALGRWAKVYGAERNLERKAGKIAGYSSALSDSWQIMTQMVLFGAVAMLAASALDPGNFVAFLVAFGVFQAAFVTLSSELIELYAAQPQIDRALPILRAKPELSQNRKDPGELNGAISVRDVTFAYEEGQPPILSGVSLDIEAGAHVAIVGSSGSGKSTLLRLLLGFETPGQGGVYYDDQDFAELDASLVRSQIGVVLQSSSLFAGSIIENIRGSHDASLEDCLEAADRAGLRRDLDYFPMGIHTPITEGAAVLSGGQRQRILIARALVAKPKMLFFDEATSALDNKSQAIVAETLDAMSATRVTIAHRLSTVEHADTICVLQKGRIIEQGSYASLMAEDGFFAALARRQITEA